MADTVTIIGRGRLLADEPVAEVVGRSTEPSVLVGVADADRAVVPLAAAGLSATTTADGRLLVAGADARPPDPEMITRVLARQELYVRELTPGAGRPGSSVPAADRREHLGAPATGGRSKRRAA